MENASKALLMAGGVLIAILVITMFVALKSSFDNTAQSYVDRLDAQELQKYNSNFEAYEGRNDITAQEIVTLINFAKQKEQGTIIWVGTENITDKNIDEQNTFLYDNLNTKFSYDSIEYNEGKVTKVVFEENMP